MPLTISKLSATCDVVGCDKQADASLARLKSLGWSTRYLQNGLPEIAPICLHAAIHAEPYKAICPRCSVSGYYKKMELPS